MRQGHPLMAELPTTLALYRVPGDWVVVPWASLGAGFTWGRVSIPGDADVAFSGPRLVAAHIGADYVHPEGFYAGPWVGGALDLLSASDGSQTTDGSYQPTPAKPVWWWSVGLRVGWFFDLSR
jgi:hypothetical protein